MDAQFPHRAGPLKPLQNTVGVIVDIVVIGSVLLLPCLWKMDTALGMLTQLWWQGQEGEFVAGWKSVDTAVFQAAGGTANGNTALSVSKLNADNPNHVEYADAMLMRGGYALYPRRIWAALEGTTLNGGPDVIKIQFYPPVEWLRAHNVRSVLEGKPNPSGKVDTSMLLVRESSDHQ